jgi:branched-chain amino acid transport system substrate-binding protein
MKKMNRRDFMKTTLAAGVGATVTTGPTFLKYALGETPVKYGCILPLSGVMAELSADQKIASEISIEEINKSSGILGRQVELIIRDSEGTAPIARRKAEELCGREKVDFLGGTCTGWEELAISEVSKRNKKNFFVYPQNFLDNTIKDSFNELAFDLNVSPYYAGASLGKWVGENLPGKRWHLLADNYSWPRMWMPAYKKWAEKTGKEWTGETWAPFPCKDYSTFIPQVLAKRPDVLFTITWGSGQISQIKQFAEFGMAEKMPCIFGVTDIPWAHAAGKGAFAGLYAGMPWYWELQEKYPKAKSFNDRFFAKSNRMPAAYGQVTYEGPILYRDIANEIKSLDPFKVAKALEGRKFQGLKSDVYIRACDHLAIQEFYMAKGKAKKDMKGDFDFFDLQGSGGVTEELAKTCQDKNLSHRL